MRLAVILIFISVNCFSQNLYQILEKAPRSVFIGRTVAVDTKVANLAEKAILARSTEVLRERVEKQVILRAVIEQHLCYPEEVAGGYNYLRAVNRAFRKEEGWEYIGRANLYNGAHHIINKSALELIYLEMKRQNRNKPLRFTLSELQGNAPAVFHFYHNSNKYRNFFHDRERQIGLYYKVGVYGILDDFFKRVDRINELEGLPCYNAEFKKTTFLEAELWAKTYGLIWKM